MFSSRSPSSVPTLIITPEYQLTSKYSRGPPPHSLTRVGRRRCPELFTGCGASPADSSLDPSPIANVHLQQQVAEHLLKTHPIPASQAFESGLQRQESPAGER